MPTSSILRFCLCSVVSIFLTISISAQRSARTRTVPTKTQTITTTRIESVSIIDTASFPFDVSETEDDENKSENILSPECRETKQVNISGKADSYPYITEDGLRLYFTSNREGGHGRFFISTRKI